VAEVIALVQASGGIQYAHNKMVEYRDGALDILKQYPDNEARQAMEGLVHYAIDRKY
jgi:octaprenyl-diphosphate synthase